VLFDRLVLAAVDFQMQMEIEAAAVDRTAFADNSMAVDIEDIEDIEDIVVLLGNLVLAEEILVCYPRGLAPDYDSDCQIRYLDRLVVRDCCCATVFAVDSPVDSLAADSNLHLVRSCCRHLISLNRSDSHRNLYPLAE